MRIGHILSLPDTTYTAFGRIKDEYGSGYTIEPGEIPEDADIGDEFAYKVDLWGNDSGLGYGLRSD